MLLAIDTATRVLSLALHDGQQIHAEMTWTTQNQHTVELMPAIRELLEKANFARTDLSLLAVSQGPGSFNGLRIGFSVAKGLALALGLPLVAIPTLDVIAAAQPGFLGTLIAVVQAGRGRVCAGGYHWHTDRWTSLHDLKIVGWQALLSDIGPIKDGDVVISGEIDGEGLSAIARAVEAGQVIRLASPAFALRRAGFLAQLAWERWQAGTVSEPAAAVPLY